MNIIPAFGWYAEFDDGSAVPLICWAVPNASSELEIEGVVNDGELTYRAQESEHFVGYVHEYDLPKRSFWSRLFGG